MSLLEWISADFNRQVEHYLSIKDASFCDYWENAIKEAVKTGEHWHRDIERFALKIRNR